MHIQHKLLSPMVQKILPKILTLWVERNNVADDRHRRTHCHTANVT